jgi:hypothetical protein
VEFQVVEVHLRHQLVDRAAVEMVLVKTQAA